MHVALYHDSLIPPVQYGGTERVLCWLAKGLLARGHSVTLIARAGSKVDGARFIEARSGQPLTDEQIPSDVDIVHLHATPPRPLSRPYLVTIHGNGQPGEKFHPNTIFLSRKHAENHGSRHFVYNGLDPADYPCDSVRGKHLVFLAKASWKVKNLAGAIEIARTLDAPLEVLGSRELPLGLHKLVPPFRGVRYRGMVDDWEKKSVLRHARALLFPVRWEEPFGLAVIEALASGCPVVGTPYGSLPEILNASCGALSAYGPDLVHVLRTRQFMPDDCRKRVLEAFTHLHMADAYLAYYQKILKTGRIGAPGEAAPQALFHGSAENLLPWQSS